MRHSKRAPVEIGGSQEAIMARKAARKQLPPKVKTNIERGLALLGFFVVWQLFSYLNQDGAFMNPKFLPGPIQVLQTWWECVLDGSMWTNMVASFSRTLFGFASGVIVAVGLGSIVTHSKILDNIITPILKMIGPIPSFAFLPMFIVWFGVGDTSKIILIAYSTFMPLMNYTIDGMRNVNPALIRSARSLGANSFQVFTKVTLKSALPNIFVGMRTSLGLTFGALVIAEMIGASEGLGFMIQYARSWFMVDQMFAAAAMIGVEYTIFSGVISLGERALFKWRKNGLSAAIES